MKDRTILYGMLKSYTMIIAVLLFVGCGSSENKPATAAQSGDPLPGWNDGPLKTAIIDFVTNATKEGSSSYIPPEKRIATFDNDGTLWAEKPYVQELFAFYMVEKMVAAKPELARKQPFKAVIEGDKAYFLTGGDAALIQLVGATHTGTTEDQFEVNAKAFVDSANYPLHGNSVSLKQITYQPQIELLNYLRANGFKTFIVTGGTIELVRAVAPQLYGISKEQVVGTTFKYKYVDSNNSIMRLQEIDLFDDKEGKPVGIQQHIGRRPAFACGNEGGAGDLAMLKYSAGNSFPTFQIIVNHDDSTREFFYREKDSLSLKTAAKNNWHVASIKNDWKTVFVAK